MVAAASHRALSCVVDCVAGCVVWREGLACGGLHRLTCAGWNLTQWARWACGFSRVVARDVCDGCAATRHGRYFLPWHFDFLLRYRPLPSAQFEAASFETPLLQTRFNAPTADAPPLERLLSTQGSPATYDLIAAALWEAASDADAVTALTTLATSGELLRVQAAEAASAVAIEEDGELGNIPSSEGSDGGGGGGKRASDKTTGRKKKSRYRAKAPERSPEEIAALRAERAAKRERTGAPPHVEGTRRR